MIWLLIPLVIYNGLQNPLYSDFPFQDRLLYIQDNKIQQRAISQESEQILSFDTLRKGQAAPYDGIIFTPEEVQEYYSSEATTLQLKFRNKALQYELDIERQECKSKLDFMRQRYYWTVAGITFGVSLTMVLIWILGR